MDENYLKEYKIESDRFPYDWAVLELLPHEKDPRLRKAKVLKCNFDYSFSKEDLINIPGYPDERYDFADSPKRRIKGGQ